MGCCMTMLKRLCSTNNVHGAKLSSEKKEMGHDSKGKQIIDDTLTKE